MKKLLAIILAMLTFVAVSCKEEEIKEISVVSPGGALSIALADLANKENTNYQIELNKTVDVLQSSFLAGEKDVIIAPINLGAQMYKNNQNYRLAAIITWGNLFFASKKADFCLDDLNGANVIMFGQGTINDVIVKYCLEQKGITLGTETTYLASTQLTVQQLLTNKDENTIVLVAEPALSTAMSKNAAIKAISVQDLYQEITKSNSYPQAGCFVNSATVINSKKAVDQFLSDFKISCDKCKTNTEDVADIAVALEIGDNAEVLAKAIPNSNISYVTALASKGDIEKEVALNPKLFGGAAPVNEFYYS